jgi:hypothetical protein
MDLFWSQLDICSAAALLQSQEELHLMVDCKHGAVAECRVIEVLADHSN